MTEKFQNKYRISTARLQNWDYGSNAAYFITICTKKRIHYFGTIDHGKMVLNEIGQNANICYSEIKVHFPFVILGNFVVMPNHIHAILIINKTVNNIGDTVDDTVSSSEQPPESPQSSFNKFGPQSKNLASIVRGYKIGVTKFAKTMHPDFAWQPRFYDHIIRNAISFEKIQNYITNNPLNWNEDKFNK